MKKLFLPLLLLATGLSLFAQQRTCLSTEVTERKRASDPNYDYLMRLQEDALRKFVETQQQDPYFSARAVRTIPVVVHVVYNTTAGNVSDAAIQTMISQMNADYRKLNTDFNTARAAVQAVAADAQIEFCLAKQTPTGATTTGIERTYTTKSCWDPNTEADNMKYTSSNGANAWDPYHYLNVWIVSLCGSSPQTGGVAGYSYVPATGNGLHGSSFDGLVIDYSIGMGAGNRTWTHEIGHYLGLHHTWGDLASNACGNTFPSTDDGFSDTPDSKAPNYFCNYTTSCTGNSAYGDQIENYMDYADCTVMFTTQQANYMNNVLTNIRSTLVTNNNKCGTVGAPTAGFTANPTSICTGQTVTFTNTSTGSGNTYSWSFPGGTPATSTATNPTVTYNTAGTYSVTLTATNSLGNNTSSQTNLIVVSGAGNLPLTEGFENTTFPPTGWSLNNADASTTWTRTTSASGFGTSTASAYVNNYNYNAAGQKDWLITPSYNFTGVTSGRIKWDYAYAPYNQTGYNDSLIVLYSTNCGVSWTTLWAKGGTSLGTATASGNNFAPTAAQWKKDSVSLASISGQGNVRFAFKNACQYGNNIFLDNVNIYNATTQQATTPVADFVGTPTTVIVGNTVAFTDLSTNTPTSWSWSFTGGTPTSSTTQNPTVTYNTVGVYPVSLTATNTGGSNTATKQSYITVIQQGGGTQTCDTLSNILAADTLTLYTYTNNGGYLSGNNNYGDLAKAEYYANPSPGAQVSGAIFYFAKAKTSNPSTSVITAKVWNANGTGNSPGTLLASQTKLISQIVTDVTNQDLTYISFSSPPTVTGNFFVGFEMSQVTGDTVAVVTTTFNSPSVGYGWEQWGDLSWNSYDSAYGNGMNNVILPVLCTGSTTQSPTASFTGTPTAVCAGSTVNFTSTSTGSPTSYSWTFTGGTPSTSTLQNPSVVYNTGGTYNVSLTVSNAGGNNTSTQNNYITVYSKPALVTASNAVLCYGGSTGSASVTATGSSPFTYNWSGGGTSATIPNKPAGNYTVTVYDSHQCSSTASVSITQPLSALTLTPAHTDANCNQQNGTASVTATGGAGGYTYLWNTGATTAALSNVGPGTYSVTVNDANNCSGVTSTSVGNAPNNLTVSIQATNASCGQSNGSAAALPNAANFAGTYSWSNQATTGSISNLAPGTYSVTITNTSGCTATATSVITNVASSMNVTFTSVAAACSQSNGSITAAVSGGGGSYTYNWSSGGTSATISNQPAGSYTVTVTDNTNCTVSNVGTISNANAPTISISQTAPLCFGGTNGSATATVTGGTPAYTYNWSSGSSSANAANLTGGSTYVLSVTDASQCLAVQSVTINNPVALVVSIQSTHALCGQNNGTATAVATGGNGSYSYAWSNLSTQVNIASLQAGTYTVSVFDGNQCSATASAQIANSTGPTSVLNPINGTCQIGPQINVTVLGGTAPFTYAWSNGATTEDIMNINAGTYTVTITDGNGCKNINTTTVTDASAVSVTFTTQNPTQGNSNGSVTANPSGGTSPYLYNWSNGSQLQTISNLPAGTYSVTITDNTGCTKVSSVTIGGNTGVENFDIISLLKVYPNPANDLCYLQIELAETSNLEVQMYNSIGQIVWTRKLTDYTHGTETMDMAGLSAGAYTIHVKMNNSVKSIRFMKM
ncbi:MAG: PKD domain-containing protein [Chitinophagales bacterium]